MTSREREAAWVKRADVMLREWGAVVGTGYPKRHLARYRARRVIEMMVRLGLHERQHLREHTEELDGEWRWTIELCGMRGLSSTPPAESRAA